MTTTTSTIAHRPLIDLLGAGALALATAAAGWLWLAHDTTYQIDPATGAASGPYEPWQVIGCVVTLLVFAVAGGVLIRPWLVIVAMTVAAVVEFAVVAGQDETGLWLVGALILTVGMLFCTSAVSYGAWLVKVLIGIRRQR